MNENEVNIDCIDAVCVLDNKAASCRKYGHEIEAMRYEESARQMLIRMLDKRVDKMSLFYGSHNYD